MPRLYQLHQTIRYLFGIFLFVAFGLFISTRQVEYSKAFYLHWDEAYVLQASYGVAHGRIYSTSPQRLGNQEYGPSIPYFPGITTGPTVLLPIAALESLTHQGLVRVSRQFSYLWTILFLLSPTLYFLLFLNSTVGATSVFLSEVILLKTPLFMYLSSVCLGEIPGLVCFIFGEICLQISRQSRRAPKLLPLFAGLAFGFSILSKNLFTIPVAVVLLLSFRRKIQKILKAGDEDLLVLAGTLIPVLLWQFWQIVQAGQERYNLNWEAWMDLFGYASISGYQTKSFQEITQQTITKASELWRSLGTPSSLFLLSFTSIWALHRFFAPRPGRSTRTNDLSFHEELFIAASFQLFWFLTMDSDWYPRHAAIAVGIFMTAIGSCVGAAFSAALKNPSKKYISGPKIKFCDASWIAGYLIAVSCLSWLGLLFQPSQDAQAKLLKDSEKIHFIETTYSPVWILQAEPQNLNSSMSWTVDLPVWPITRYIVKKFTDFLPSSAGFYALVTQSSLPKNSVILECNRPLYEMPLQSPPNLLTLKVCQSSSVTQIER